MQLWLCWWDVILLLHPAFSRWRTFVWFTVCVAGLSVRADNLGVTSIIRALGLDGKYYDNLLDNFHSTGVKLDALSATWAKVVLRVFPGLVRVNGRLVLVGDGIKVGKQGRKMPGVHHGSLLPGGLHPCPVSAEHLCRPACRQNP